MSLNTPTDMKLVVEVPANLSDAQIQGFLDDANLIIMEDLSGKGLSDARLKTIEKYLCAHLIVLLTERGGLTSSQNGDAKDSYTPVYSQRDVAAAGLQMTRWGQQAILYDTSGTLKSMSKNTLPGLFSVVGDADDNGLGEAQPTTIVTSVS